MYQVQITCKCGGKYWPRQKWMHEGCGVEATTTVTSDEVVVNAATNVVVNADHIVEPTKMVRSKDRHKQTPERLAYLRQKMKEYRARQKARG